MPKAEVDPLRTEIRRKKLNQEHQDHKAKIRALEMAEEDAREARIQQLKDSAYIDNNQFSTHQQMSVTNHLSNTINFGYQSNQVGQPNTRIP